MGVCNCSMFCCTLLYVKSSIAIILMGKRELVALLNLSSWCLVMVERLFLAVPWGSMRCVIVVFPDHTHLLFLWSKSITEIVVGEIKFIQVSRCVCFAVHYLCCILQQIVFRDGLAFSNLGPTGTGEVVYLKLPKFTISFEKMC